MSRIDRFREKMRGRWVFTGELRRGDTCSDGQYREKHFKKLHGR